MKSRLFIRNFAVPRKIRTSRDLYCTHQTAAPVNVGARPRSCHLAEFSSSREDQRIYPMEGGNSRLEHGTIPGNDKKKNITSFPPVGGEEYDTTQFDDNQQYTADESDKHHDAESATRRLWLDPSTALNKRVDRFVDRKLGALHPLDIILASTDLIKECGALRSFEGMKYAHDVFDRVIEEKQHVNSHVLALSENSNARRSLIVIPELVFKTLMYGWSNLCRHGVKFAPQRMREILDKMIQEAEYDEQCKFKQREQQALGNAGGSSSTMNDFQGFDLSSLSCQPTVDIYNTMLQGLAEASRKYIAAAIEAEDVLLAMAKRHRRKGWHTKPNTRSYSLVIIAFARTKHATAGDRAEAVLRKMIDVHIEEKASYFEETGVEYDTLDPTRNKRRIVTPDVATYSSVIQAYANCDTDGAAQKAFALLLEVVNSEELSPRLDAFIFAVTINAFVRVAANKSSTKARVRAAKRAEQILWLMVDTMKVEKERSALSNYDEEVPDKEETAKMLRSSQRTGQWGSRSPVIPFNACLKAWSQTNAKESPWRAEALLYKMLDDDLQAITGMRPDIISFNTCLHAWARASSIDPEAPRKAEALLQSLVDLSNHNPKFADTIPDVHSLTIVMDAYGQSNNIDKAKSARRLLDKIINKTSKETRRPLSAIPFTVLLNAVAHSPSQTSREGSLEAFGEFENVEDVFTLARDAYRELCDDVHNLGVAPDHFAFASMLDVLFRHTHAASTERRQMVEAVFNDACAAGQVSELVLKALQNACPTTEQLAHLLGRSGSTLTPLTTKALPREWTRHVPLKSRRSGTKGRKRRGSKKALQTPSIDSK